MQCRATLQPHAAHRKDPAGRRRHRPKRHLPRPDGRHQLPAAPACTRDHPQRVSPQTGISTPEQRKAVREGNLPGQRSDGSSLGADLNNTAPASCDGSQGGRRQEPAGSSPDNGEVGLDRPRRVSPCRPPQDARGCRTGPVISPPRRPWGARAISGRRSAPARSAPATWRSALVYRFALAGMGTTRRKRSETMP